MSGTEQGRGPFASIGYAFKRVATFFWGPADLREEVDPIVALDREQGVEPSPPAEPRPTERQRSYDNLPRGTAE
ncbi:MAG TPA: hypothetical protein VFL59_04260 [Candidatus Nanopelagicales bacterium]|nr:hypothetical protein [Candidatus Nanopelagicales bacterium]